MKKKFIIILLAGLFSCDNYLDIVPDQTQQVDLLFERKEVAYTALATCYAYLPKNDGVYTSFMTMSDEITTPISKETDGVRIMKGQQSASNPKFGLWSGWSDQGSLWEGIRHCNILIENIHNVVDMTEQEMNSWAAEAKFLKAYYHFLLFTYYGPIPIVDENLPISASDNEVRVKRSTVDQSVDYIVQTIDDAILDLPVRELSSNDLGRIDQVIAKSIKSRVLLYAASPLFNGNSEMYSGFVNEYGEHYFNQTYDQTKWDLAKEASLDAINAALENGVGLYEFSSTPPNYEDEYEESEFLRTLYDLKYTIVDKWNSELIWGNSNPVRDNDWWQMQAACMMKNPSASSVEAAWQWIAPTLRIAELFYTENGLPIDQDLTYDFQNRFNTATVSASQNYQAQYGTTTAKLNLNREPRFYSSLGFDRGYNRTWGNLWQLRMKKGEIHGRIANSDDYLITGYALKKLVHPDSEGDGYNKIVTYAWPMIRLSELYLNYAEAINESTGPNQDAYDALNAVRERAGISNVEDAWGNASISATLNKHTTQDGFREIIRQERLIELSFEGNRYNDIRRWKQAEQYFNSPVFGWSVDETSVSGYYNITQVGIRSFNSPRDYFHPISINEITINPNLTQNLGW
ncbi:MAG: RagB/SusD family nutrient uptake outer membrane protein [Flavobacteriaceae bacterium]|nr:RagB/SusD family nutrient uptake outer membrane protein [Flavobacteriaceae bacterium]